MAAPVMAKMAVMPIDAMIATFPPSEVVKSRAMREDGFPPICLTNRLKPVMWPDVLVGVCPS
ncbi:hypothetical protein GCM10007853_29380 [Algimonas ampicilliniresistens]|uniref:Uncharacterized protein n=1 Tax=Algimonas ampicilliniresistens TaxID=1298735 RepID=A0ABQ5VEH1_9PROT|nr:hypothetical protein GCM10007853_29380 [Algimonas ampicilliniresistens]